jgi:hypothetical protein
MQDGSLAWESMAVIEVPKIELAPTVDPYHAAAVENVKKAVRELQAKGIIDAQGKRIGTSLPDDMREGSDRDFGG